MDIIIEDNVLYRDRKKWMRRLCKLARPNNFSDSVKLLVCTADDGKSKRGPRKMCSTLLSKHVIYGHLHGVHMGSQSYVMYIVCKRTVECLAFEDFDTMKLWSDLLGKHLHDISQFVDLVYADKHSQLKNKLEGRLFFNCSHISFIRSPSTCEPKLLMSWKIADVMEYGSRNVDKKNSSKGKPKNYFGDDTQNLFIMRVSPMCQRAPNTHIFSCKDPKQFCNWIENLASNQDNVMSRPGCAGMISQRSRLDSYSGYQRCRSESESSPDFECNNDTMRFFPEVTLQPRIPRYQRSMSEVRQARVGLTSVEGIEENDESAMTDPHCDGRLSQSDGSKTQCPEPDSPTSMYGTLTWLERYPYEREKSRNGQTFRRQMSECVTSTTFSATTPPWPIDGTLPRPKSSNNYCSLLNIRQRTDSSSLDPSPPYLLPTVPKSLSHIGPLHNNHELASPRYVNLVTGIPAYRAGPGVPSSPYANIEFDDLLHEISEYCLTDKCAVQLRYADLTLALGPIVASHRHNHRHYSGSVPPTIHYIHIDIDNTMVLKTLAESPLYPPVPSLHRHSHHNLATNRCICM